MAHIRSTKYPQRKRRQIIAHHLILPLYGHWAPNDPRGSGSMIFYNEQLDVLGPIHFGRKPHHLQPSREEVRDFHRRFKAMLQHNVFWIDDAKRQAIANAISMVIAREGYKVYACAICSNHAHLVVRIHRDDALTLWNKFADESRLRLRAARFSDISPDHPVWADRPYKVFLYSPDEVEARIDYVNNNPSKEGLAPQYWDFVTRYDNWPLHKPVNHS